MDVVQEAAKGLQEQLGDPSALVLIGSPEQGKVAIVVSLSEGAVKKVCKSCCFALSHAIMVTESDKFFDKDGL